MGFLSRLFGRSDETDDEREIRLYNEEKSVPHTATEAARICPDEATACFAVGDVFTISGRGTVVTGTVTEGSFSVGDYVTINSAQSTTAMITGIEQFRKLLDTVHKGDNACLLLQDVSRNQVGTGDLIIK